MSRGSKAWRSVAAAALLGACWGNSQQSSSRPAPGASSRYFDKVLVVYVSRDDDLSRAMENDMARRIPRAIPAYKVIPRNELCDLQRTTARIRKAGFDGAVVMRLAPSGAKPDTLSGDVHVTLAPASQSSMWPYWNHSWAVVRDPREYTDGQMARVETAVYSLADGGELLWSGRSDAYEPGSVPKRVDEIVNTTANMMNQDELLITPVRVSAQR